MSIQTDGIGTNHLRSDPVISIIGPVRDRTGYRIRNFLRTLRNQSIDAVARRHLRTNDRIEIIISDMSLNNKYLDENEKLCAEFDARHLRVGYTGHWNKCLAMNVGIKASRSKYVMLADIDMIFKHNFIETVVNALDENNKRLILCQAKKLVKNDIDDNTNAITKFQELDRKAEPFPHYGTGGIQSSTRDWFYDVCGYDEDYFYWGCEDGDMTVRAQMAGLQLHWIEKHTSMLHQWHVIRPGLDKPLPKRCWYQINPAMKSARARSKMIKRNPDGWGDVDRVSKVSLSLEDRMISPNWRKHLNL